MRARVVWLLGVLALPALGGCQILRDVGVLPKPDPLEQRGERLRLPPDLSADGVSDAATVPEGRPAEVQASDSNPSAAPADAPAPATRLDRSEQGGAQLALDVRFYDAWRQVGLALDRLGFTLESRDRAQGKYFIRYDPEAETDREGSGLFSSLAFWRDDEKDSLQSYVIDLHGDGDTTVVTVTSPDGEPAAAEVTERILALLSDELR